MDSAPMDSAPMVSDPIDDEWFHPPLAAVREVVARSLAEDLTPLGDLTSALLDRADGEAAIVAREPGRLAGTRAATEVFAQLDPAVAVHWSAGEGALLARGQVVATLSGPFPSILTGERSALNLLGHLSGIASLTARYVAAAEATGSARIWDTRKTTPGLRALEKAAVRAGGGRNHRGNLSDWMLVKDNHLGEVSITEAVRRGRDRWPARTVHVECDSFEQCVESIEVGADAVLLDNMTPDEVRACVEAAAQLQDGLARRTLLEVSGGVTLDTVGAYSGTGVDMISVGAITNSAPVLDLGLDLR